MPQDMLLQVCILSGCDYVQSIKGMGFKTALRLVKECKGNVEEIVSRIKSDLTRK